MQRGENYKAQHSCSKLTVTLCRSEKKLILGMKLLELSYAVHRKYFNSEASSKVAEADITE